MQEVENYATLLIHCRDSTGLVATVSSFIQSHQGNITDFDQHVDAQSGVFFMRARWSLDGFALDKSQINGVFERAVAKPNNMTFELYFSGQRTRMAIFVSKMSHCLYDLLASCEGGKWPVDVPLVISNHEDMRSVVESFGVEYHCFKIIKENKAEQEAKQMELLEKNKINLVVLARYMQIVSDKFATAYTNRMINIHHSFLPAFPGAKPYHQAYDRGVKVIGATSHYVTAELDAGPIIVQEVTHVSHRDDVSDLLRKGRDLEKLVLSRAVWHHVNHDILSLDNKTVVFE